MLVLDNKLDFYDYEPTSKAFLLDLPTRARVVLLLDDLEFLGSTWRTTAVDPNDVAVKENWASYVSTLLTAVVAEACKLNTQLRVAFSLTQTEYSHQLLSHNSALVFPIAKLTLPSSQQVESLLRAYLEGRVDPEVDMGDYARRLVGPPRNVQRFLQGVRPSGGKIVLRTKMEICMESVRFAHETEVCASLNLTGLRNKRLLKAACEVWAALRAGQKSAELDGSDVFPITNDIEGSNNWKEVEGCGLLRSRAQGSERVVEMYPFLTCLFDGLKYSEFRGSGSDVQGVGKS